MKIAKPARAGLIAAIFAVAAMPSTGFAKIKNIVLVHGMNMDASAWRAVSDRLAKDDYHVSFVQMPMTSMADDIAATRRVIAAQDGPVLLVGHSYGGFVITQAGTDPSVKGLVYVAAYEPEIGETLGELNSSMPSDFPQSALVFSKDGYFVVKHDEWISDVANGASPADAEYTARFQRPVNSAIFGYKAEVAAWHDKPAWAVITLQDRTTSPRLQAMMSKRSGATTVEIDAGHLVHMSHPDAIAALIEKAADSLD